MLNNNSFLHSGGPMFESSWDQPFFPVRNIPFLDWKRGLRHHPFNYIYANTLPVNYKNRLKNILILAQFSLKDVFDSYQKMDLIFIWTHLYIYKNMSFLVKCGHFYNDLETLPDHCVLCNTVRSEGYSFTKLATDIPSWGYSFTKLATDIPSWGYSFTKLATDIPSWKHRFLQC